MLSHSTSCIKVKWWGISRHNTLCQSNLCGKFLEWISSLYFCEFYCHVLVQELINSQIASTNTDLQLVLGNFNLYSFCAVLILTSRLPHEHNLELVAVREVVDEVGQLAIHWIIHLWNVNRDFFLQIDTVHLQSVNLFSLVFNLSQEWKADLVCLEDASFKLSHIINRLHHLLLVLHSEAL